MKKLISVFCVLVACAVFLPSAYATTITFDALTTDDWSMGLDDGVSYTESGYVFSTNGALFAFGSDATTDLGGGWTGSAALSEEWGEGFTLLSETTATSGSSLFSLESFDISELYTYDDGSSSSVTFTVIGTLADGSTVTAEVSTDGTFGLETIYLGEEFSNLVSVYFSSEDYQIDNVVVNTSEVPLPAAFLLLGSGLPLLISARRRNV